MGKILVVGAGFAGATYARILADSGLKIDLIDERPHIAGNCYDFINEIGQLESQYGPHIFHTNNTRVIAWLSKFTEWVDYKHRVKALHTDGKYYTLPVNKETEDLVGSENIIDVFFKPYSYNMWGMELEKISASVLKRVNPRKDNNEYYFPKDSFQKLPSKGYTELFKNLLNSPNISVYLNTKFSKESENDYSYIFNSMPIDDYYNYIYGPLEYRSIKFDRKLVNQSSIHKTLTTNFTEYSGPTRVTDYSYLPHNKKQNKTITIYEYPCDYKENNFLRYYPVKDFYGTNKKVYNQYRDIPHKKMKFIGRCGTYQYLDIDQVVNQSLAGAQRFLIKQKHRKNKS